MPVQLKVSLLLREGFGSCRRHDRTTDLTPEVCPIQNTRGLWEVFALFFLDPLGSISKHDRRARWIGIEFLCGSFHLVSDLP